MIDIGVNLLHPQFESDRVAVLERAKAAGVTELMVTATDLPMSRAAIAFCEDHDLYCTAGVHPHDAKDAPENLSAELVDLSRSDRVKAIGETGLDFNRNFSPPDVQRTVFETQLRTAIEVQLPVFVHDRDSEGQVYEMLRTHAEDLSGIVIHCFTGSGLDLSRYLSLDCFIGITGWICDSRRGVELRELIHELPLEKLLIETDAPFLLPGSTPAGWHAQNAPGNSKRRNEPALLGLVTQRISEELGIEQELVEETSSANARRLFNLAD